MRKEKRKLKILSEDDFLLVLEKPSGLVVDQAETVEEKTLQDFLIDYLKIKGRGVGGRAGIVHRLDKETSGLLLVAKTPKVFQNLQRQFKEREVEKRYLALVHGRVEPKEGVVEASIARSPFDRKKFGVFLGGRAAKTRYQVKEYYHLDSEDYSLLELKPTTGRTHQIRVHLKHLGHPVVGDEKYAGRKTARRDRRWCPRHFLHATSLVFTHPQTGKKIHFTSQPPADLKKALKTLHG